MDPVKSVTPRPIGVKFSPVTRTEPGRRTAPGAVVEQVVLARDPLIIGLAQVHLGPGHAGQIAAGLRQRIDR